MRSALEDEAQAAEADAVGAGMKTGVTVDLSRKNIQKLPEEVVDIMKNELERYEAHQKPARAWTTLTSHTDLPYHITYSQPSLPASPNVRTFDTSTSEATS